MGRITKSVKPKKDLFETVDFDVPEEDTVETQEEEPLEEIELPDPTLLTEEPIIEDISEEILESDEEDSVPESEEEHENIKSEEDDLEENNVNTKATIVKCPHCQEEVLDMEICPVCGNPLKITADVSLAREDIDIDTFEDFDEEYSDLKFKKNPSIDEDSLFGGLPYSNNMDKYTPTEGDNI